MPAHSQRRNSPPPKAVRDDTVSDEADQLRAVVSLLLSDNQHEEEAQFREVTRLCRDKPQFARRLLGLVDRYYRLGQVPQQHYQKIRARIDMTLEDLQAAATPATPERASTTTTELPPTALRPAPRQAPGPTVTAPLPVPPPRSASASARAAAPSPPPPALSPTPPAPAAASPFFAAASRLAASSRASSAPGAAASAAPPPRTPLPVKPATQSAPANAESASPPAPAQPPKLSAEARRAPDPQPATADALSQLLRGIEERESSSAGELGPGTVLRDRYEMQGLLGYGGMAAVYKAKDRFRARLGLEDCHVAIKLVVAETAGVEQLEALGREFHNAQQLSHPNIINVYEIDRSEDSSFYTMELLEGEQLNQLLERIGGPLPARQALAIIRDIGAAVAHAHAHGVVHADLKPQNVFITYGGQVRVLDFGGLSLSVPGPVLGEPWIEPLAAEAQEATYRTATPAYASCQQLEGQRVDPRDDVYALACIAYELLTGLHPFEGRSSTEARARHMQARRPAALKRGAWRALRRGLAWPREQRPGEVEPWLEQLGIPEAVERLPPSHQLRTQRPRRRWAEPVATAALALIALIGALWFLPTQNWTTWGPEWSSAMLRLQRFESPWRATITHWGVAVFSPQRTSSTATPAVPAREVAQVAPPTLPSATAGPAGARDTATATPAPQPVLPSPSPNGSALPHDAVGGAASSGQVATAGASGAEVAFGSHRYSVTDDAAAARLVVHRLGNDQNDLHFVWWTQEDTAKADVDYAPLGRREELIPRGANAIAIYVPIISNPLRHQPETFYVALGSPDASNPDLPSARASVTIQQGG